MIQLLVIIFILSMTQGSVLSKIDKSFSDFYEIDNPDKNELKPEFIYYNDNLEKKLTKYYKLTRSPDKSENKENMFSDNDDLKDYVIVKAKRQLFNISPYVMMRQLDDIKYMVLWLNLYCEIHPDCDKETLNKELRKILHAVAHYFSRKRCEQ